jgi:hypothetical protein
MTIFAHLAITRASLLALVPTPGRNEQRARCPRCYLHVSGTTTAAVIAGAWAWGKLSQRRCRPVHILLQMVRASTEYGDFGKYAGLLCEGVENSIRAPISRGIRSIDYLFFRDDIEGRVMTIAEIRPQNVYYSDIRFLPRV